MHLETSPTEDREEQLDRAVVQYLRAVAAGHPPDREQFLADHPGLTTELSRFFADQDEVARLAAPLRQAAAPPSLPSSFASFELLEEIGRGGMGVVYRAHDRALNRTVAVKMVALGASAGPAALARFRNEAQAAARLQHPNVVQIFEVGEHNGQPYLVLEYVEGGSLAQQLRGQPLPAVQAARLVETLASAIHAAHQCGVIHRDLKPANVLLSFSREPLASAPASALARGSRLNDGVPKITDFGLAKQTDADAGTQTETGAILGTPGYMAPEQAEGRGRQPGPATDVYALGALLYELLTGRPPFLGATRLDTLQQIVYADPVPPRRLTATVPRDLDTICLKCLQKEQPRRYASAHDLADDLRRFQAGEPIRARPVGRLEIAWRWCRRRPAQALLGAALLVAVVTGVALVVWQWRRAEDNLRETERLRLEAVDHEAEVDDSFRLAHQAVKDFMTQAGQPGVLDAHGLEPLRRDLLRKAQSYYRKFLQRRGHDPALRRELAETSALLADVTRQIGPPAEALDSYRRSLALYEALPHDGPGGIDLRAQEAVLHNHIGGVLLALGRYGEALDALRRAESLLKGGLRVRPGDAGIEAELASTYHNQGLIAEATNRPQAALAAYAASRTLCEKLLHARPDEPKYQLQLANTLNNVGVLLHRRERMPDAVTSLQEAVALYDKVAGRFPRNHARQFALAKGLCNLGDCLRESGQFKESAACLARAHPILEQLDRMGPPVLHYRLQFALSHAIMGLTRLAAGEPEQARDSFRQAKKILRVLVLDHPEVPDYQVRLATVNEQIAETHTRLKHDDLALRAYGWARDLKVRLVEKYPDQVDYHSSLGVTMHNAGLLLHRLGRHEDARAALLRAAAEQRLALDRSPDDHRYRRWLSNDYAGLVAAARALNRPAEVADATAKRVALWPRDGAELYAAAHDCAPAAAGVDKPKARQRCAELVVKALRLAVAAGFRDAQRLRSDAALKPLRPRQDFQKLLADMPGGTPAPRP